jgi:hypothetical protein
VIGIDRDEAEQTPALGLAKLFYRRRQLDRSIAHLREKRSLRRIQHVNKL